MKKVYEEWEQIYCYEEFSLFGAPPGGPFSHFGPKIIYTKFV